MELEILRRHLYLHSEAKRQLLKSINQTAQVSALHRRAALYNFVRLPRFSRTAQAHFICLATARSRGVLTRYGLSRFAFRTHVNRGYIVGVRRAS